MLMFLFRWVLRYRTEKELIAILCFLCRRQFTNICLDAVSCYLVELQSMSPTLMVQTTIGNFKSLQAKLERLHWFTNTRTESLVQVIQTEIKVRMLALNYELTNLQKKYPERAERVFSCHGYQMCYSCYSKSIYKL